MAKPLPTKVVVASSRVDKHNSVLTFEALEQMVHQIRGDSGRAVVVGVEHDRTVPPLGIVVDAEIQVAADGHHEVVAQYAYFEDPVEFELSESFLGLKQSLQDCSNRLSIAEFQADSVLAVKVDYMNFASRHDQAAYFNSLRKELREDIIERTASRKSLVAAKELIITIGVPIAAWLAMKFLQGTGEAVKEIAKDETKSFYSTIRSTILNYSRHTPAEDGPTTYVLQVPGDPNIEFVVRTADPHYAVSALTDNSFSIEVAKLESLTQSFEIEFVQFINFGEGWKFNYVATPDGTVFGSKESYDRRAILLSNLGNQPSGSGSLGVKLRSQEQEDE